MVRYQEGRQRNAAVQCSVASLDNTLIALEAMTIAELKAAWTKKLGTKAPQLKSRDVLLRLLAWQLQAEALGGLDTVTERKLRDIATSLEHEGIYKPKIQRSLSAGVVLAREWKGVLYKVTVTRHGFQHLGKNYRSLSDIARTITGTRWSGPRFFGLEQKKVRTIAKEAS